MTGPQFIVGVVPVAGHGFIAQCRQKADDLGMSAAQLSQLILFASFVIWVVYGVLAGMRHWPAAVSFGLLASIGLLSTAAVRHIKVKLLDWVLLGYFVIAAIATFAVRSAAFPGYSSVVIWTLYAAVTWASILRGAPFSLQYARESAPLEHWNSPGFLRANRIISVVWGAAFVINIVLVLIALYPRYDSLLLSVLAPLVTMGASAVFTSRYAKISRARALHGAAD